jgi:hypothetical protein
MDTLANRATVRISILSRPSTPARIFFPACVVMQLACPVYVYRIPPEILQNQTLAILPTMPSYVCRGDGIPGCGKSRSWVGPALECLRENYLSKLSPVGTG